MITVSVVTYHTPPDELRQLFGSLSHVDASRIYVVDNGSSDYIRDFVTSRGAVYIPSDNVGYGAGHNKGMARAKKDWPEMTQHLVVNTDISFEPKALSDMSAFMSARPEIGCLQPKILSPDGSLQHTCRLLPTPFDLILRRFLPSGWFSRSRDRYLLKNLDPSKAWNIPYHQGSFMLLSRAAMDYAGGFDERFFVYPEDIDLTRRIHRRFVTLYWPGASVMHDHRAASYSSPRMLGIHIVNMIRYFNKHGWFCDGERRRFNAETGVAPYVD